MNKFLRTTPTRQLLGAIAGMIVVIAAGAAIAIAAQGSGPVPPPRPLAQAIHQALSARALTGVSARIKFTNNLIDSSEIQGSDPLLSGASGRLWVSSGHALRLELQGDNGDANVVVNNGSFWAYDPSSNTVYEGKLPAGLAPTGAAHDRTGHQAAASEALPTIAQIQSDINRAAAHLGLSGAIPGDVAGQAAYTLRVSPKQSGGLLGGVSLAWDALRGVPLRVALYARGSSNPVLELTATNISFGTVSGSVFSISPPAGAKVVQLSTPTPTVHKRAASSHRHVAPITGVRAVAGHLQFTLQAPGSLAGIRRSAVRLVSLGGKPGALLLYGHGLGGLVVLETGAVAGTPATLSLHSAGGDRAGLNLPSVSIGGTPAQELDTAIGTLIRFERAGVQYTVIGSVKPAVAVAAARAL